MLGEWKTERDNIIWEMGGMEEISRKRQHLS